MSEAEAGDGPDRRRRENLRVAESYVEDAAEDADREMQAYYEKIQGRISWLRDDGPDEPDERHVWRPVRPIQSEFDGAEDAAILTNYTNTTAIVDARGVERTGTVCATVDPDFLEEALDAAASMGDGMVTLEVGHDIPILAHPQDTEHGLAAVVAPRIHQRGTAVSKEVHAAAEEVPGYDDPLPNTPESDA